ASSASSTVKPGAVGNGGDIDITTESLSLTNRAGLDASTSGQGNAGNVRIRASRAITFDRASSASSTVKPGAVGNGGDIDITTESLSLTNRTGLDTTTYGQGKAGNVKIQASGAITFDGGNEGVVSSVQSSVGPTGMGDGGNIDIQSSYFSLTGGAELISGVFQGGQGNSGNITINVSNYINLSGVNTNGGPSSGLFTDPEENSKGQGGDILLSADVLKISDGATLSARTRNAFRGGNIIVNVNSLDLTGGGQILTAAFDKGDAGDITIEATKGITISGSDPTFDARLAQFGRPYVDPVNSLSGLFANTDVNSTGKGGSITITTGQLQVQNQAQVTVSSTGEGIAGELGITANTVKLNNGSITAQTRFGNGGDLTLGVKDLLLLRNSSQISTTAGNEQNGGDGGNITIKAPNGFIFAVPSENSDITANAFSGSGGRVDIKAFGIYGIEFRESPTPLSDITASSKFGIQGIVELNTPVIEINSGLIELPTIPVDTKLAQGCYSPGSAQNRFVITGRGGLPPNPKDILTPDTPQIDWVSLKPSSNNRSLPPVTSEPTTSTPKRIVEATGATLNAKGQIVLSAKSSTSTLNTSRQNPIQCHGS
ncbi:MAG: S-layer family protein, partial [Nostoc sp.]